MKSGIAGGDRVFGRDRGGARPPMALTQYPLEFARSLAAQGNCIGRGNFQAMGGQAACWPAPMMFASIKADDERTRSVTLHRDTPDHPS